MSRSRGDAGGVAPRLRIALVIDYSLDYLGGAQSAFLDEAEILLERGHDVTIVAPVRRGSEDAEVVRAWRGRGGDVIAVPYGVRLAGVDLPVIRNTEGLRARLDREFMVRGVDVVHVHSEFGLAAAAISVARRRALRTAQTVHTFFWQGPPSSIGAVAATVVRGFGRWLRGFPSSHAVLSDAPIDSALRGLTLGIAQRVDVVISPSAHQAERLREAGVSQVAVVPNALAVADSPGEPLAEVTMPLRIVWVGRLVPEKRLLEWVDAVVRAADRVQRGALEVEIIGEGDLREEAEEHAIGAPVRFLGRLSRDEVQARMRDAHLVALSSHGFDNQPVTIVEALHARRGVLYVDPALTEGVDAAGIRADAPSIEAMASLIVELVNDPARVIAASARAAEGAEAFDPDTHASRLTEAYRATATR